MEVAAQGPGVGSGAVPGGCHGEGLLEGSKGKWGGCSGGGSNHCRTHSGGKRLTREFENLVDRDEGEGPGSSHRTLTEEDIIDLRERHYASITERQKDLFFRERETLTCCSTDGCIHWLHLVCALTRGGTRNLSTSGWCSNQLSYPTRAQEDLDMNI